VRFGGRTCQHPPAPGLGFGDPWLLFRAMPSIRAASLQPFAFRLTSNLKWALAPGNVSLSARVTGLPKDSVANVSQVISLDKSLLSERVSKLPRHKLELLFSGIDLVLGK